MKNYFVRLFETFTAKYHEENHCIHYQLKEINMLLSELLTKNQSIAGQLNKVEVEIVTKLAALQAAVDDLTEQLGNLELMRLFPIQTQYQNPKFNKQSLSKPA
jgi:ACT domain-containing protein